MKENFDPVSLQFFADSLLSGKPLHEEVSNNPFWFSNAKNIKKLSKFDKNHMAKNIFRIREKNFVLTSKTSIRKMLNNFNWKQQLV